MATRRGSAPMPEIHIHGLPDPISMDVIEAIRDALRACGDLNANRTNAYGVIREVQEHGAAYVGEVESDETAEAILSRFEGLSVPAGTIPPERAEKPAEGPEGASTGPSDAERAHAAALIMMRAAGGDPVKALHAIAGLLAAGVDVDTFAPAAGFIAVTFDLEAASTILVSIAEATGVKVIR